MTDRFNCRGFTLIELIAVMIVMGVVLFAVVGHVYFSQTAQTAQIASIKAHLRYAQAKAIADTIKWGLTFNGSSYWLFKETAEDSPIRIVGMDHTTVDLPVGMSHSGVYGFDDWGKPYRKLSGIWTAHDGSALSFGAGVETVTLTKNTGFIP